LRVWLVWLLCGVGCGIELVKPIDITLGIETRAVSPDLLAAGERIEATARYRGDGESVQIAAQCWSEWSAERITAGTAEGDERMYLKARIPADSDGRDLWRCEFISTAPGTILFHVESGGELAD
jgi:hypothetical protein